MDQNTLAIHLNELRNLANNAKASFDIFNQSLEQKAESGILYALHSILWNASQISSVIWPSRARARKRGEDLRSALQIPEKYALNDRRLIEMFEREDEKLDEFITNTKGKKVVFDYIGDLEVLVNEGVEEAGIYRAYDPLKKIVVVRGTSFSLDAIAKALMEVGSRIMEAHAMMFPEQRPAEEAAPQRNEEVNDKVSAETKQKEPAKKKSAPKKKPEAKKKTPAKKAAAKKSTAKKK